MDGLVFLLCLGLSFGLFGAAYRTAARAPHNALVFSLLAAGAAVVCTMGLVADPDGVVWRATDTVTYSHTLAASMDTAAPPPEFDYTFNAAGDLSGWLQARYNQPVSGGTRYGWDSDHGGSIKLTADGSRAQRFDGLYLRLERPAGTEWDRIEFDYRITGLPGRHGLEVGWSCDACFLSESDTVVSASASTADTGWQHATLQVPIVERDLQITWRGPLVSADALGSYSPRTIALDNVKVYVAGGGLDLSTATASTVEHGDSSAGRFVLTGATTETEIVLVAPTDANRTVAGGLFTGWAAYSVLFGLGQLPALLSGGRR